MSKKKKHKKELLPLILLATGMVNLIASVVGLVKLILESR